MPNAWPSTLPQFVALDGYDEAMPHPVKRTRMGSGPAKQRREFTAAETTIKFATDTMSAAQAAIFETFYFETLKHGSLEWDWVHPRTQATKTYRFTGAPKPVPLGGGKVYYILPLEIMP